MQTWRSARAHTHVKAAIDMFESIEANVLMEKGLPETYQDLRNALTVCDMLSHSATHSKKQAVPSTHMAPTTQQAALTSSRTIPTTAPPIAFYRL